MIAAIQGKIFRLSPDSVILMAGGVGYELLCHASALAELAVLQANKNDHVTLLAYTHVTENSLQLFGFIHAAEKEMFLSLLKVNGIGAKTAMNILSGTSLHSLRGMIEAGDVKSLSKLPKVGKKTAEQMILTLKGKLVLAEGKNEAPIRRASSEIGSALINLGFRSQEVEKVVQGLPEGIAIEDGIRQGLAALSNL